MKEAELSAREMVPGVSETVTVPVVAAFIIAKFEAEGFASVTVTFPV